MAKWVGAVQGALGNAVTDLIGLWGVTATTQPASSSQAAVTTLSITAASISTTTITTGAVFLNNSTHISVLQTSVNDTITRVSALTVLVNQLRADLISSGNIKGSA